jgi:hypothetical protein
MKRSSTFFLACTLSAETWLTVGLGPAAHAAPQQWMDYFEPTPIISPLSSTFWGAKQVGPRDQANGLEDKTMKSYNYWDGGIIKDEQTGTYHMFASRWAESAGHNGWMSDSHCVHATSSNLYGPYTEQGLCFTDNAGMCHNVNALKLRPGDTSGKKFAITCSGSVAGSGRVYGADSLDGPWTYLGDLKLDLNGHTGGFSSGDNFRTILRPDGKYECINGLVGIADNVIGPYKAQMSGKFTDTVLGHIDAACRNNMEDPFIFYSGTQYHVMVNCWSAGKAYFYSSSDGITWKAEDGYAYDPTSNMVRYTDGSINHWKLLERPSVYIENGHAVAMTFAAINVPKDQCKAGSGNGSKVIVVPVDGLSYDSGGPPGSAIGGGGADGGTDTGSGSDGKGGSGGTVSAGSGIGGSTGLGGARSVNSSRSTGGVGGSGGPDGGLDAGSGSGGKGGMNVTVSASASSVETTSAFAGTDGGAGSGGAGATSSAWGGASSGGGRLQIAGSVSAGGVQNSSARSDVSGGATVADGKGSGCSCTVGAGKNGRAQAAALLLLGMCVLTFGNRHPRRR